MSSFLHLEYCASLPLWPRNRKGMRCKILLRIDNILAKKWENECYCVRAISEKGFVLVLSPFNTLTPERGPMHVCVCNLCACVCVYVVHVLLDVCVHEATLPLEIKSTHTHTHALWKNYSSNFKPRPFFPIAWHHTGLLAAVLGFSSLITAKTVACQTTRYFIMNEVQLNVSNSKNKTKTKRSLSNLNNSE